MSQQSLALVLRNVEGGTLSKWPVNWHNSPSSACHHQAFWAGQGVSLNLPMVGSMRCMALGARAREHGMGLLRAGLIETVASGAEVGLELLLGTLPHHETPDWCPGPRKQSSPRGFSEAWALCNLSAFYSAAQALC